MAGSKRSKRVESTQFGPVPGVEKVEKPNEVAFDPTRTSTPRSGQHVNAFAFQVGLHG